MRTRNQHVRLPYKVTGYFARDRLKVKQKTIFANIYTNKTQLLKHSANHHKQNVIVGITMRRVSKRAVWNQIATKNRLRIVRIYVCINPQKGDFPLFCGLSFITLY